MRLSSFLTGLTVIVTIGISIGLALARYMITTHRESALFGVIVFVIVLGFFLSIKLVNRWERVVVSRLGQLRYLTGPGLFFIIPIIDLLAYRIDTRLMTTGCSSEKSLTKDTIRLDVDAGRFWNVMDPEKGSAKVFGYQRAIRSADRIAPRDVIGKTRYAEMMAGKGKMNQALLKIIDHRVEPWFPGVN